MRDVEEIVQIHDTFHRFIVNGELLGSPAATMIVAHALHDGLAWCLGLPCAARFETGLTMVRSAMDEVNQAMDLHAKG